MKNIIARKLSREVFNFAREGNFSGWFILAKYLLSSIFLSDDRNLRVLSETLAHFPMLAKSDKLICRGLSLGQRKALQNDGCADNRPLNLSYSCVVKSYVSPSEKGLFLISFENQLEKIIDSGYLPIILERYMIVFLPSWTGLFSPALFKLAAYADEYPIFVLPVHESERGLVSRLGKHVIPLEFNAASWVNDEFFAGECFNRDVDCLIVANFASFKRHWILFKALRKLPETIKVLCVGVPLGTRTAKNILDEASDYGVERRVEVVENPSQEILRTYFQRAKVFCAMSHREGSFISVAEALISGTPVVMFKNAHIGTKFLITPETGALVGTVSELRKRILEYIEFKDHDRIRRIARRSISARQNCIKLNRELVDWSRDQGLQWTKDIEPFYCMRLSFYYYDDEANERLKSDFEYLATKGIKLSSP